MRWGEPTEAVKVLEVAHRLHSDDPLIAATADFFLARALWERVETTAEQRARARTLARGAFPALLTHADDELREEARSWLDDNDSVAPRGDASAAER